MHKKFLFLKYDITFQITLFTDLWLFLESRTQKLLEGTNFLFSLFAYYHNIQHDTILINTSTQFSIICKDYQTEGFIVHSNLGPLSGVLYQLQSFSPCSSCLGCPFTLYLFLLPSKPYYIKGKKKKKDRGRNPQVFLLHKNCLISVQACLRNITISVPDHCSKVTTAVKQVMNFLLSQCR